MNQEYGSGIGMMPVQAESGEVRAEFIVKTYAHLFGAIIAFVLIEVALFQAGVAERLARTMLGLPGGWLTILGGFMVVSWIASRAAHTVSSSAGQYAALAAFVAAEALIFVPLLYVANQQADGIIASAGIVAFGGFTGLTVIAFMTRKDFSFLGGMLRWAGFCALGAIVVAVLFDFSLGVWFSMGMIVFAGGAILYDTSQVLHHYPKDRHVAASLELFASVALLFWYVLRLFMASRD